jgi:photosystem II stability/assembly factor-like uncharacterized protein
VRGCWLCAFALGCGRVDFGTGPHEWTPASAVTASGLNALSGDDSSLFAVGDGGVIIRSDDRGRSWTQIPCPATVDLHAITKIGTTWLAVGAPAGGVFASTDGGNAFIAIQFTSSQTPDANWFAIAGHDNGTVALFGEKTWAVGSGDYGADWGPYGAVYFSGDFRAAWPDPDGAVWVSGSAGLVARFPGDFSNPTAYPAMSAATLYGLWGRDATTLFAVGDGGALFVTRDAATWTLVPTPTATRLSAVTGNAHQLFIAGDAGYLGWSPDDGKTLSVQQTGTTQDLHAIWLSPDGRDAVAVGAAGTVIHADNDP